MLFASLFDAQRQIIEKSAVAYYILFFDVDQEQIFRLVRRVSRRKKIKGSYNIYNKRRWRYAIEAHVRWMYEWKILKSWKRKREWFWTSREKKRNIPSLRSIKKNTRARKLNVGMGSYTYTHSLLHAFGTPDIFQTNFAINFLDLPVILEQRKLLCYTKFER